MAETVNIGQKRFINNLGFGNPLPKRRKTKTINYKDGRRIFKKKSEDDVLKTIVKNQINGFCESCTNPYKLISCINCYRSWHPDCLFKHILPDNVTQIYNDLKNMRQNKHTDINNMNEYDPSMQLEPILYNQDIDTNDDDTDNDNDNDDTNEDDSNINKHIDEGSDVDINMNMDNESKTELTDIESEHEKGNEKEKDKYYNPINLETMNLETENTIVDWFKNNIEIFKKGIGLYPLSSEVIKINCKKPVFSKQNVKQIIGIFKCKECITDTHACFICKNEFETEKTYQCLNGNRKHRHKCGKYYHLSCLKNNDLYNKHTVWYQRKNHFKCPKHHCWECFENNEKNLKDKRRVCWYCPREYHRACCPHESVLVSMQTIHEMKHLKYYPDFRYDIINCNDIMHGKCYDLKFGRNDKLYNIFKWVSLYKYIKKRKNNQNSINHHNSNSIMNENSNESSVVRLDDGYENEMLQFFKLTTGLFTIDIEWILNKKKYKNENNNHVNKKNPWPTGFKKITRTKNSAQYNIAHKKKSNNIDFDTCQCDTKLGCKLDTCSNANMLIECTSQTCRVTDESTCENRRFSRCNKKENICVRHTQNKGFGAYAKRDIKPNELILEYVGERITKKESKQKLKDMNDRGCVHFYFFQMDSQTIIDASKMGNEARFLNHSCEPNCQTLIWDINGERRLGIFAKINIKIDTELTYDYQYEVANNTDDHTKLASCLCGSKNCRLFLGYSKKQAKKYKQDHPELMQNDDDIDMDIEQIQVNGVDMNNINQNDSNNVSSANNNVYSNENDSNIIVNNSDGNTNVNADVDVNVNVNLNATNNANNNSAENDRCDIFQTKPKTFTSFEAFAFGNETNEISMSGEPTMKNPIQSVNMKIVQSDDNNNNTTQNKKDEKKDNPELHAMCEQMVQKIKESIDVKDAPLGTNEQSNQFNQKKNETIADDVGDKENKKLRENAVEKITDKVDDKIDKKIIDKVNDKLNGQQNDQEKLKENDMEMDA